MSSAPSAGRWYVAISTSDGRRLRWHKQGRAHALPAELGPVWIANFKPALFQVMPDGALVARGADAQASDIVKVELEPADG